MKPNKVVGGPGFPPEQSHVSIFSQRKLDRGTRLRAETYLRRQDMYPNRSASRLVLIRNLLGSPIRHNLLAGVDPVSLLAMTWELNP